MRAAQLPRWRLKRRHSNSYYISSFHQRIQNLEIFQSQLVRIYEMSYGRNGFVVPFRINEYSSCAVPNNENADEGAGSQLTKEAIKNGGNNTASADAKSESDWKQLVSDVDGHAIAPVGELTLDEFLDIEEMLRWGIRNLPVSRETIEGALTLYRRLLQDYEANNLRLQENYEMTHWYEGNYPRSVKLLDEILTLWHNWWPQNAREEGLGPEEMLALIENLRSGKPPLAVKEKSYSIIIAAATEGADPKKAPYFAERILGQMLVDTKRDPPLRLSNQTFGAVMNAWAKSGLPGAPEKVDSLFNEIRKLQHDGIVDHPPDNVAHLALMQAWSKSGRKEAPVKIEAILESMKLFPSRYVSPTIPAYRLAIHSWVNSSNDRSSERAHALFVELVNSYMNGDENMEIDSDFFSIVIAKLAREDHFKKAEEIFQLLEQLYTNSKDDRFKPSPRVLLAMVIAYSKSGKPGDIEKAESILLHLQQQAEANDDINLLPKRGYYGDVINGLCNSRTPDAADRAESLLFKMVDHHCSGVPGMLPDRQLFDAVIRCWTRQKRINAAERAEALLDLMETMSKKFHSQATKPDERSYLHVLTAWARSRDPHAPEKSEKLFFRMFQQYNDGDASLQPSMLHYTSLVSCWARSRHEDAPNRAQTLFDAAMELYSTGKMGHTSRPDRHLYASLMRAWSNAGEGRAVEAIFLDMFEKYSKEGQEQLKPDTYCFNIMLEAWSRSGNPDAYEKALIIFDSMLDFSEDNTIDVPPDALTYQLMVHIFSKSHTDDAAKRAEEYLELFKASRLSMDPRSLPKIFPCYVSTIAAWSQSQSPDAISKIEALVDDLRNLTQQGAIPLPSKSEYIQFLTTLARSAIPGKANKARDLLGLPKDKLRITRDLL